MKLGAKLYYFYDIIIVICKIYCRFDIFIY